MKLPQQPHLHVDQRKYKTHDQGHLPIALVKLQELLSYNKNIARRKQSCMFAIQFILKIFQVACWYIIFDILESNHTLLYLISSN